MLAMVLVVMADVDLVKKMFNRPGVAGALRQRASQFVD